jgi:hypothetical protein
MIENNDIDLTTLMDRFTECEDYTKEVILEDLQCWQKEPDFLCLIDGNGFLVGYRNRNALWVSQVYNDGTGDSRKTLEYAKQWARDRGMTKLTAETKRDEMRAMERYGFKEFSLNMECKL